MDIQRIKKMYKSYKDIFIILESGNIMDERYKLLLQGLTIEDVEKMREFINYCEDTGIQLTKEIN